jgi:hypothetical protein
MPYCIKRSNQSKRAEIFSKINYAVDKLHIKGHIGKNCKKYCHPDNFPFLRPLNTVICEQKNFWLGKYKYSLKHMSVNRYNFFIFILCDSYNQLNIDNKLGFIENHYMSEKTDQAKRKYAEPLELIDTDIETSGVFSSDSLSESPSKRQKLQ